jgi:glucose uptake protein
MMLPATYVTALLLAILTMLCWGSWANTLKLAGKWRFELYYFDYTLGLMIAVTVAAFTFGSWESEGARAADVVAFSFMDNMLVSSKTQMAYAMVGGAIFNLANLLLVAAIAVAGLSVAFPVGIGLALIVGVVLNTIIKPAGHAGFLFSGVFLVLLAIIASALAHSLHTRNKAKAAATAEPQPARPAIRRPGAGRGPSALKGILLSLAAGLLMGLFYPLVEMSKTGDIGLGPYAAAFMFGLGVLVTTPVYNLFFMNLPVEGDAVAFGEYFKGTLKQHLLGLAGGAIWAVGAVSNFVAASAPASVNVGPGVSYALGQGATLVSTLWGLLVWNEFAGATPAVKMRIALMLALFIGGLTLVSLAPLFT